MKAIILFLFPILLSLSFNVSAQTTPSKWRWGVGAGFNTLWLPKGEVDVNIIIASDDKETTITRVGNRFGYQFNTLGCYQFSKRWALIGGVGLTKAASKAYKRTTHKGHFLIFPSNYVSRDTIALKYLILDTKVNVRFKITALDEAESNLNMFVDVGINGEIPLVNNSSYSYSIDGDDGSYSQGKLSLESLSPFLSVGIIGKHYDWSLGCSLINNKSEKDNHSYNAVMTRLMVNRFF